MKQLILPRIPGVLLFVCIWLAVWCQPELRLVLVDQLGTNRIPVAGPFGIGTYVFDPSLEDIASRYPNDENIAVESASRRLGFEYGSRTLQHGYTPRLQAYDAVIRRFPNQAWIIALRLCETMQSFQSARLAGDFDNRNPPPYTTPSPEKSTTPPNFTPAQLQASIDLAYQGRKLESDNCFFDWALVRLLMDGYRDDEAYRVLHEGSRKLRYDDHGYDQIAANIARQERMGQVSMEHKFMLMGTKLDPHYKCFRSLARLMAWQAWKAERLGDYNKSIRLGDDMAHLAAPMMRGRNDAMGGIVAMAIEIIRLGHGSLLA